MRPAITVLPLVVLLGACDGGSSEDEECLESAPSVRVTVTDLEGPVTGATVELDGVACPEVGGGVYGCTATEGGPNQLYVYAMNHVTYNQAQQGIPAPSCDVQVVDVDVELQTGIL